MMIEEYDAEMNVPKPTYGVESQVELNDEELMALNNPEILKEGRVNELMGRSTVRNILQISLRGKQEELDGECEEEDEPYYWDDGENPDEYSSTDKIQHNAYWMWRQLYKGMDFTGNVFANLLGLNESRYQWAIDELEREKQRIKELEELKEKRRELERELSMNSEEKLNRAMEDGTAGATEEE